MSKHHYAIELAKENQVFFLGPPEADKQGVEMVDGVGVVYYQPRIRGINKIPGDKPKRWFMKQDVSQLLKLIGGKIDVVWSFDSSRFYFLDLFKAEIKIAHIVDHREDFFLKELSRTADVCLASSDSIVDKLKRHATKVFKVQHGFIVPKPTEEISLPGKNKLKGVYVGNLDIVYFDWKVLNQLSKSFKNVDFILIGPISQENSERIDQAKLSNVYFLPKIDSNQINTHLISADFCFQLYDVQLYPEQLQNPHKTMQYIGSGTPIFSSHTHEYEGLNLLCFYDKVTLEVDFNRFLDELPVLRSEPEVEKRKKYAIQNSYSQQIQRIEQLIFSLNEGK